MKESDSSKGGDSQLSLEIETLIQRYLDEDLNEEGFALLQESLKGDPAARQRYREATKTVVLLREEAGLRAFADGRKEPATSASLRTSVWLPLVGACLVILLGAIFLRPLFRPAPAAFLASSLKPTWLSSPHQEGGEFEAGTKLHLATGRIEIRFRSGAISQIIGPALFEIESENGGFLHYGKVVSIAEGEASKGFTIQTPSGTYVDQGTEFVTEATADGYSQMLVLEGAVDADAEGFGRLRVGKGNGIGFDPGDTPIMIQIEQGSATIDFEFPSIPPPSESDFASTQPVSVELDSRGRLEAKSVLAPASAGPEVLFNGRAQRNQDDPGESFFFRNDTTGYLLFDLGKAVSISGIHTYSWHRNERRPESTLRAVQRYTVWGAREERPTGLPDTNAAAGWERVARVDTDAFFGVTKLADRPSQQACRLTPASGSIGDFRYLLFEVLPTGDGDVDAPRHTFFSEIDIFSGN